jgi:hypothetical protein
MDPSRFDGLIRTLSGSGSRRRALAALGGALGLFGWHGIEDVAAHDPSKDCKKKSGKQKQTCLKKARKHKATHRRPTCSDGIKNGRETGVDCGGGCQRCPSGQSCASRNDCASAMCTGVCKTCTSGLSDTCGGDSSGMCSCRVSEADGSRVCVRAQAPGSTSCYPNLKPCPAGMICVDHIGSYFCHERCGAA